MSLLKFIRKKKIVPISATTDIVIIDKNGYIGEKRPNGNTVYFGYLDSFADFSDKGLGQVTIIPIVIGEVTIGGRKYKTTKIGNQEWLAENLDYKFYVNGSQIPVGVSGYPTTPTAWYYSNNESTYGWSGLRYGLLYNWYAAKYLNDNKATLLPNGWHVPTPTEFDTLATAVGGASNAGRILKSTTGWSSGNGIDNFGFAGVPSGGRYSGSFYDLGIYANFWTTAEYSSYNAIRYYFDKSAGMYSYNGNSKTDGYPVRLVKNVS